jgi:FecR protein
MRERYADLARRLVRGSRTEPPPSLPSDRRRLVAAVAQALHARARRRATARVATTVAAVAAALTLVAGGLGVWRRGPAGGQLAEGPRKAHELTVLGAAGEGQADVIRGDAKRVPVRRGMTLEAGIRLVAPDGGEVRIGTAAGTALTLEPGGDLIVAEATSTQRFTLSRGAVRAHVARLFSGERFIVDTGDAEVEVHGTVFRVAVVPVDPSCGGGSTTRVSVVEGVVNVRSGGNESRVFPGGEWPAGCSVPAAHPRHLVRHLAIHNDAPRSSVETSAVASPATAAAPLPTQRQSASALAAQNDLFAAAVGAHREGRLADGVRLFARLIDEYPGSPLLESAVVQRMKLLAAIDPARGARAAAEYLERFPGGFAHADAQQLAGRSSP